MLNRVPAYTKFKSGLLSGFNVGWDGLKHCHRDNGVYSFKWRLTERLSEVGDTSRPAAGPGRGQSVQIEWISAGTAHRGFPALWSVPHLLSREIKMNRRHYFRRWEWDNDQVARVLGTFGGQPFLKSFHFNSLLSVLGCCNINFSCLSQIRRDIFCFASNVSIFLLFFFGGLRGCWKRTVRNYHKRISFMVVAYCTFSTPPCGLQLSWCHVRPSFHPATHNFFVLASLVTLRACWKTNFYRTFMGN